MLMLMSVYTGMAMAIPMGMCMGLLPRLILWAVQRAMVGVLQMARAPMAVPWMHMHQRLLLHMLQLETLVLLPLSVCPGAPRKVPRLAV